MPVQLFTNNAVSTIAANLGIGVLTIDVAVGEGALFPVLAGGDWFNATIESGANKEIIKVTARATDTLTIERAQEGTSDQSWTLGDTIELRLTNAWLSTVHTEDSLPVASIGDVVGPASSVDSQVAMFDGTTGKLLKDSGLALSGSNTGDQTISDATISFTDITTNDVTTSKHGFVPKAPNDVTQFLDGLGAWSVPDTGMKQDELVINGNMNLWQRGTSFTAVGLVYHADQFEHVEVSAGSVDVSRLDIASTSTFHTASGTKLKYALKYDVNTIDASVVAGDTVFIAQKIEGYRAQPYMHNEFTVSFWVRSNITGTFCFGVRNSVADKSFVKEFTIDVADTWEQKTITVPTQDQTGTWDYTTGIGMEFTWCLMSGTTFGSATDNTWNTSNSVATTNQTNWMATATNDFDITGVQADIGPSAQALRVAPIEQELLAASRYYQKSYDVDVDPGANPAVGGQSPFISNGTAHFENIVFPVPMRAAPTIVLYSPNSGATGNVYDTTPTATDRAATSNSVGEKSFAISITTSVDLHAITAHYTAAAEL